MLGVTDDVTMAISTAGRLLIWSSGMIYISFSVSYSIHLSMGGAWQIVCDLMELFTQYLAFYHSIWIKCLFRHLDDGVISEWIAFIQRGVSVFHTTILTRFEHFESIQIFEHEINLLLPIFFRWSGKLPTLQHFSNVLWHSIANNITTVPWSRHCRYSNIDQ